MKYNSLFRRIFQLNLMFPQAHVLCNVVLMRQLQEKNLKSE